MRYISNNINIHINIHININIYIISYLYNNEIYIRIYKQSNIFR